jgi:hypothetical protein
MNNPFETTEVVRAKYKIEFMFGKRRSNMKLNPVIVTFWESGKKFHGGGDCKAWICGYEDCQKLIGDDQVVDLVAMCPVCNRANLRSPLTKTQLRKRNLYGQDLPVMVGEKLANVTLQNLAVLLERLFRVSAGSNADFYMKLHRTDLRYDPLHEDKISTDVLTKARGGREAIIYPLNRVIADTIEGNLIGKLRAFLNG